VAARRTPQRPRAGAKQLCKSAYLRGDECIAVPRDLWFEELGFPHPVNACQGPDPWRKPHRQQDASGLSRRRRFGAGNGSRDKDQTSRMSRKSGTGFPIRTCGKIKGRLERIPVPSGEQEQ
jgi:hypothetical protein